LTLETGPLAPLAHRFGRSLFLSADLQRCHSDIVSVESISLDDEDADSDDVKEDNGRGLRGATEDPSKPAGSGAATAQQSNGTATTANASSTTGLLLSPECNTDINCVGVRSLGVQPHEPRKKIPVPRAMAPSVAPASVLRTSPRPLQPQQQGQKAGDRSEHVSTAYNGGPRRGNEISGDKSQEKGALSNEQQVKRNGIVLPPLRLPPGLDAHIND